MITKFKYCPYCGKKIIKPNMIQINFCPSCGKNFSKFTFSSIKKVSCIICHENVSLKENRNIKCPYCGSQFHRRCITNWLIDYNSCPLCMNTFLLPERISAINRE
jgi:DNA-directed RNA polymerase subunit RPC12/RpoP